MAKHTPAQLLAKTKSGIRAECAKQGIDDASRKAMMMRLAGVASSTELNLKGALAVMDHLRKTGGPARRQAGKPAANEWGFVFTQSAERKPFLQKIYRVAEKIGALQTPPVPVMSKAWVEGTVKQSAGLNQPGTKEKTAKPLETCGPEELHLVIQILESWAKKLGDRPA